ncbi:DUF3298 and DUF4163 domain-containing protein [Candidatus Acetatifactor stercoripullorum]|uniref:DUF3298 and DUF4163 domain-containing protein n=1 Tax=Candidatus Acetatifactor stercoripullorum TaxID=2838414 RepID=UPI00298E7007|nr:DUF3298 domain-containing protein [Candidatus Acetatifactor stercoripullorum]
MSEMKDAKDKYDAIPIPEELGERVQAAIESSGKRRKILQWKRRKRVLRGLATSAAAVAVVFTVLLNTNTAFAREMSSIPVVGAVARVLTFRTYEAEEENVGISVEIPSVEMISADTNGLADSINQEIYQLCEEYAKEAVERAMEYRTAFLETGGTEEEWAAHDIQINVWYEVKAQTPNYLSFVVRGSENWTSAYREARYYTIDLQQEKLLSLNDVLGENDIEAANESIRKQMEVMSKEDGITFWTPEEGGFTGITEETPFYINENENLVIVFEKYQIAPGSAGDIEFEIER